MSMVEKTVSNYVLAGLTSTMPSGLAVADNIKTRMFRMDRHQTNLIAPHSHRYCLFSKVIEGTVTNTLWKKTCQIDPEADAFWMSTLSPIDGGLGEYKKEISSRIKYYKPLSSHYGPGDSYYMHYNDIHSISFSKGAVVQILEYPEDSESSYVLEPAIDGKLIPLARTEDWMFSHD